MRRRISDDGKLAVAIKVQSPNNISLSRMDGPDDEDTASRSVTAC